MNRIQFLKGEKIKLNGITYNNKEGISEWFNYKGLTYIVE